MGLGWALGGFRIRGAEDEKTIIRIFLWIGILAPTLGFVGTAGTLVVITV